ncbi:MULTISPECIES: trimeric intracellular cation channel family protein [Vibrio]|nr:MULTISPECIES: trimeric intracellular cation channel family protein [Vibrio]KOE80441.1 membrane protein [Vibrio alginolyticus]MBD1567384.1 trimeric intracellular cation channel family protein [Vibrio sp. S12_S33]MDE1210341.1 trimeric intracellular cation channel family protein [Vibrio aestuarianus]MDE1213925.1 trimeric intracellular cation channel family protein [Vibrio aestuarianus]MDE1216307.1 trimeric intracellular cation channel family protein [Vibrio aestuarianus]
MLLSVLYIIGITAEAMTGALSAGRRKMDWFGVMLVASATAIGGGTVRDILLGHYPLGWVKNPEFLAITCLAGVLTTGLAKWVIKLKGLFIRLDALGLIVFSIIGTKVAMSMGHHAMICMVAALVTGVFGGLLRDLICRQTPLVLHEELYASVSLVASGLYLTLLEFGVNDVTSTIITLVVGYVLRMAAVRFKWRLPSFQLDTESQIH